MMCNKNQIKSNGSLSPDVKSAFASLSLEQDV